MDYLSDQQEDPLNQKQRPGAGAPGAGPGIAGQSYGAAPQPQPADNRSVDSSGNPGRQGPAWGSPAAPPPTPPMRSIQLQGQGAPQPSYGGTPGQSGSSIQGLTDSGQPQSNAMQVAAANQGAMQSQVRQGPVVGAQQPQIGSPQSPGMQAGAPQSHAQMAQQQAGGQRGRKYYGE